MRSEPDEKKNTENTEKMRKMQKKYVKMQSKFLGLRKLPLCPDSGQGMGKKKKK